MGTNSDLRVSIDVGCYQHSVAIVGKGVRSCILHPALCRDILRSWPGRFG